MNGLCAGFIGLGLIGGSIAQALKYYYPDIHILAHTRSQKTLDYALSNGIIDEACEPGPAFAACDYIFLCAPVENNISYLPLLKPYLKDSAILTDVGSTKSGIHEKAAFYGLDHWFIGGHPMAGSEKSGIENAKRILLENAYYILTPSPGIDPEKVARYQELVRSLKALPMILSCQEHDFATAGISHLPHIIAASLVNLVRNEDSEKQTMKTLAAGGFKDITRIASSSPEMWEQICSSNRENIIEILDEYINSLIDTKIALSEHNDAAIHDLFAESREYRNSIPEGAAGSLPKTFGLYCDMVDEAGGIAALATILATNGISIKNIGIVHNRQFEEAVLYVEFYEEEALKKAVNLLRKYRYTIYER